MTTTPKHEAERLADWLQGAVATYPQVSECEPGGYFSELDQRIDEAVPHLRRIPALEAENEALRARLDAIEKSMRDGLEREARLMARCVELKSELEAQRVPLSEWQPIDTAPKDGTSVLIYRPNSSHQNVQEAYWTTPWEEAPDDRCWWSTPYGPSGRGYTILPTSVTHWMPLPPPPTIITPKGQSDQKGEGSL